MAKKVATLTQKQIEKKLLSLDDWSVNTKYTQISKTYTLHNFVNALAFVAKITVHAEILNHHPDIELSYGKVKVKISTHDVKGLTKADFDLAQKIEEIKLP